MVDTTGTAEPALGRVQRTLTPLVPDRPFVALDIGVLLGLNVLDVG